MTPPLISALMATNRPSMCEQARKRFIAQDYANAVLEVDRSDGSHGAKMDNLFRKAIGEFCVVLDDDDEYAPDRISKLIAPIRDSRARFLNAVGTSLMYFVDERIGKAWLYDNAVLPQSMFWMGAPLYRRSAYAKYGPWDNGSCGADLRFLRKLPRDTVLDLRDASLMVCRIHEANAAPKQTVGPAWTEVAIETLPKFYKMEVVNGTLV